MSPAHSSPTPRRPAIPAFLGGGRPPSRTLVCISSLRDLRRLLVLSLVGQLVVIALVGFYWLGGGAGGFRANGDPTGVAPTGALICRPAPSPLKP
ncbi:MAG: hypothetical protein ACK6BC_15040 [Cyanobacteriota bacterium]